MLMYPFEKHIVDGRLEEALLEVRKMCVDSGRNCDAEVIQFLSRFKELENQRNRGLLDRQQYTLELNTLRYGILGFTYLLIDPFFASNQENALKIEKKPTRSIGLTFRRVRTGEDYAVETNPNMLVRDFTKQLLFSFGYEVSDTRLITEDFIKISLYKVIRQGETLCIPHQTLTESGLTKGDTVCIKIELGNKPVFFH